MYKIRECNLVFEELLNTYDTTVKELCNSSRGMKKDERYSVVLLSLFYTHTNYISGVGAFEKYWKHNFDKLLKLTAIQNNKPESWYPLNRKIVGESGYCEHLDFVRAPEADWDMDMMIKEYLARLSPMRRAFFIELWDNGDEQAICDKFGISNEQLVSIRKSLAEQWLILFGVLH